MRSFKFTKTLKLANQREGALRCGLCRSAGLLLFLATVIGSHAVLPADSEGGGLSEYEIKAAYLYNFAKFVEWPPEAFVNMETPIHIAIVGNDPFGSIIDNGLNGKTANNRPLVIRRLKWPADLRTFQIVFIGASEEHLLPQITESLKGAPVLTVTETGLVTRSKCVVNFVMEGKKVRFEVDMNTADQARLKISSKLLMLARVFRNGRQEGKE